MKLLFDENLLFKLVPLLEDIFSGSAHVFPKGLIRSKDVDIWEYARANEFIIVTADADFYDLSTRLGHPPKVIWIRGCNSPVAKVEKILRDQAIRLLEFVEDKDRAILILRA